MLLTGGSLTDYAMTRALASQSGLCLRGLPGASRRVRQWDIVRGGGFCGSRQLANPHSTPAPGSVYGIPFDRTGG